MIKKFILKFILPQEHDAAGFWIWFYVLPCCVIPALINDSLAFRIVAGLLFALMFGLYLAVPAKITVYAGYIISVIAGLVAYGMTDDLILVFIPLIVLLVYSIVILLMGGLREIK